MNFTRKQTQKTSSDEIIDVQIVEVDAAVEYGVGNSSRPNFARVVVPDSPQLESEPVDRPQRSPVADESPRRFGIARMKLDHQLFDVRQALWTGQDRVERAPFGTLDVDLQNVDRRLRNTTPQSQFSQSGQLSSSS